MKTHLVLELGIGPVLEELPQHGDVAALGRDVQPRPAIFHRQVGVRPRLEEVKIVKFRTSKTENKIQGGLEKSR